MSGPSMSWIGVSEDMSKRREALDQMRLQIRQDTKMPLWIPFLSAILSAVLALTVSTKEGYLFVVTGSL